MYVLVSVKSMSVFSFGKRGVGMVWGISLIIEEKKNPFILTVVIAFR